MIAFILLVIGGLNWLAYGVFEWDVGQLVGGMTSVPAKVIYVVVGLAAIYEAVTHKANCKQCTAGGDSAPAGGQGQMGGGAQAGGPQM